MNIRLDKDGNAKVEIQKRERDLLRKAAFTAKMIYNAHGLADAIISEAKNVDNTIAELLKAIDDQKAPAATEMM
jgi:glycerate-2-kinase